MYPAAGSHPNKFTEALYHGSSAEAGVGCDDTRGPHVEFVPDVKTIPSDPAAALQAFPWIAFEGRWGELQRAFFNGPTGPNLKQQWTEPIVWSIARGYRLGALTDDVVQTVWLRLAENCDRIRDPERLAAWLATTTRNEALRVATKQAQTRSVSELPERADAGASSLDEIVTDDDTLRHVLHGFAQLLAKEQELLRLLCTVPPLDYATIGEMLGRPIGSIGPSRDRALAKLKKLLPPGLDDRHRRSSRKDEAE